MEIINTLTRMLNMIKGFTARYNYNVPDKMLVDFNGKRYVIAIHEVKNPDSDMSNDIAKINFI